MDDGCPSPQKKEWIEPTLMWGEVGTEERGEEE